MTRETTTGRVLGRRIARELTEEDVERISGASLDPHNICAYPYEDSGYDDNGRLICDPCDTSGPLEPL